MVLRRCGRTGRLESGIIIIRTSQLLRCPAKQLLQSRACGVER